MIFSAGFAAYYRLYRGFTPYYAAQEYGTGGSHGRRFSN
jgi:hypothetical protein